MRPCVRKLKMLDLFNGGICLHFFGRGEGYWFTGFFVFEQTCKMEKMQIVQ